MSKKKVHLAYPIFWTACNMSARDRPPPSIKTTRNKAKVTCLACRKTQGFFSRDDYPRDTVVEKKIVRGNLT